MLIRSYASSSRGNCYLISDGKTKLLIECGISIEKIKKEVGLSSFDACLVSHEHQDHSKAMVDLIRSCKKVYASKGTISTKENTKPFENYCIAIKSGVPVEIGSFVVIPFAVNHDALEPLGFYIMSNETKETLVFATDTYYISHQFKEINYLMIECNYAKDILLSNLKTCYITKKQVERIKKSHFELSNVKKFIKSQNIEAIKEIYLMHLSSTNSDADRFKKEISAISGKPTWVFPE